MAPAAPVAGEDLQRVMAAGLLVAGSSLDNPPFSFHNAQFQPDGFDIALIRAVGDQLGVPTTIRDLAFDGLGSALELGQVDLAIAAITVTPERAARVAFSTPYYQSRSAVLAGVDSRIDAIATADDLAPFRIGVQQGTVYERWVRDTLIATGKLPEASLFLYPDPATAVRDLAGGSLDVVLLDALPAQSFVDAGGVKLVSQGLFSQDYAIAMRQGSSLREAVDRALATLAEDGTIAALTERYLGAEQQQLDASATEQAAARSTAAAPTPTPEPVVPTPAPTEPPPAPTDAPCVDGLALVAVLSFDDHAMQSPPVLAPGQAFTKGWRVANIGTCAWTREYRLAYVTGNTAQSRMGGSPEPLALTVTPGQTVDLDLALVAPATPGTYLGTWQMVNGDGIGFGERLPVGIQVAASTPAPGATAPPTETAVPGITFTASATQVIRGSVVTFTWDAPGASQVYFYAQGQAWQNHPVGSSGSAQVKVFETTVYQLRVAQPDGSVVTRSIRVQVI